MFHSHVGIAELPEPGTDNNSNNSQAGNSGQEGSSNDSGDIDELKEGTLVVNEKKEVEGAFPLDTTERIEIEKLEFTFLAWGVPNGVLIKEISAHFFLRADLREGSDRKPDSLIQMYRADSAHPKPDGTYNWFEQAGLRDLWQAEHNHFKLPKREALRVAISAKLNQLFAQNKKSWVARFAKVFTFAGAAGSAAGTVFSAAQPCYAWGAKVLGDATALSGSLIKSLFTESNEDTLFYVSVAAGAMIKLVFDIPMGEASCQSYIAKVCAPALTETAAGQVVCTNAIQSEIVSAGLIMGAMATLIPVNFGGIADMINTLRKWAQFSAFTSVRNLNLLQFPPYPRSCLDAAAPVDCPLICNNGPTGVGCRTGTLETLGDAGNSFSGQGCNRCLAEEALKTNACEKGNLTAEQVMKLNVTCQED